MMLGSSGKKHNIKGLERIETHRENALSTDHPSVRFNQKRGVMQNYYIRGSVETKSKYSKIKSGIVKCCHKIYTDSTQFNTTIRAKSQK